MSAIGAKRTLGQGRARMTAYDPKRTFIPDQIGITCGHLTQGLLALPLAY